MRNAVFHFIDVDDAVYWVCDRHHMTETFTNILTNAREAMHGKGIVWITGTYGASEYYLRIKDNGEGIDQSKISNIFMPYCTTKNTEQNFGLGLAYCKNVVEKHGGNITASSAKGKGMAVTVAFPLKLTVRNGVKE